MNTLSRRPAVSSTVPYETRRTLKHYVPRYVAQQPVTYLSPWTGRYYTCYARTYSPGNVETDLSATRDGGPLVWSGTTEDSNPTSTAQVNREIADVIVPSLVKARVPWTH
ncbi:MAG: hypothetical protein ACRELE_00760 [Gemmatimonadales bacterium]